MQQATKDAGQFRAHLPARGRLMGLDLGDRTIGVATSDDGWRVSTAQMTIERIKQGRDIEALRQLAEEHRIVGIVLGYPIHMDGSEGPRCQSTRAFARALVAALGLPILLWDERMSTIAVTRVMEEEADMSRAKRARNVDKLAAAYLLQGALDALA